MFRQNSWQISAALSACVTILGLARLSLVTVGSKVAPVETTDSRVKSRRARGNISTVSTELHHLAARAPIE